jgi:hypothetical protein
LQRNFLAKRAAAVIDLDCLRRVLEEQQDEREREADAEASRRQKRARIERWGADAGEAEEEGGAEAPPPPELPLNAATDKALRTARAELLANCDLQHLLPALQWYWYPGDERRAGDGPLPSKVDIVRSGSIAGQLAHHPEDLDRRACTPPAEQVLFLTCFSRFRFCHCMQPYPAKGIAVSPRLNLCRRACAPACRLPAVHRRFAAVPRTPAVHPGRGGPGGGR